MLKYFKKIFSVVLAAVLLVTATAPSGAIAASKPGRPSFKVVKRAKKTRLDTRYLLQIQNMANINRQQHQEYAL